MEENLRLFFFFYRNFIEIESFSRFIVKYPF